MKKLFAIATLLAATATHAADSGPLLAMCEKALSPPGVGVKTQDAFQAGYCIGLLDAAFDALVAEPVERGKAPGLCPKADSGDPLTLVKVAVKYLKANPQTHSEPSAVAVRKALREAFPCR